LIRNNTSDHNDDGGLIRWNDEIIKPRKTIVQARPPGLVYTKEKENLRLEC